MNRDENKDEEDDTTMTNQSQVTLDILHCLLGQLNIFWVVDLYLMCFIILLIVVMQSSKRNQRYFSVEHSAIFSYHSVDIKLLNAFVVIGLHFNSQCLRFLQERQILILDSRNENGRGFII